MNSKQNSYYAKKFFLFQFFLKWNLSVHVKTGYQRALLTEEKYLIFLFLYLCILFRQFFLLCDFFLSFKLEKRAFFGNDQRCCVVDDDCFDAEVTTVDDSRSQFVNLVSSLTVIFFGTNYFSCKPGTVFLTCLFFNILGK